LLQTDSLFAIYAAADHSAENFGNLVMKNAWNQVKYTMSTSEAFNKHDNLLIFSFSPQLIFNFGNSFHSHLLL
jgi:hypothetical protein